MVKRFSRWAQSYALAAGLTLASNVYADDIFKGARGPLGKDWQVDERVVYSLLEDAKHVNNNFILKYWDGDAFGKWVFVSVPYRWTGSSKGSGNGFGDVSVGAGPRGRVGDLHWISYAGLTFPSGKSDGNIKLGTGRYDRKVGLFVTYLSRDKRFQLEGAAERNFTGQRNGLAAPDETYWGLLAGGKLSDRIRLVSGLTEAHKENKDFLLNSRSVIRYTVSPKLHFEVVGDIGLKNRNIPKGKSFGFYQRYNF